MRLLFVDNYDSFTYNVVHLLAAAGVQPQVRLNDDVALVPELLNEYDALVIGPGPGNPSQQPQMMTLVRAAIERAMPTLGVCLGLQAIGESFGGRIVHAPQQMHGKTSQIEHDGSGIFMGIPSPFTATRYHSLALDATGLSADLQITARSEDGVIQAIAHRSLPIHAVQFHPESVLSQHGEALLLNFLNLAATP